MGECGLDVEGPKELALARGTVEVDISATDREATPPGFYLCECKHWKTNVPKAIVHAFRTVMGDSGANLGMIISSQGFQSGAHEAAKNANIKLLSWEEFQGLFAERWFRNYMAPSVRQELDPLMEYTEPINSRIFRKADALAEDARQQFKVLRAKYFVPTFGLLPLWLAIPPYSDRPVPPQLPLRSALTRDGLPQVDVLPGDVLDSTALRPVLDGLVSYAQSAIAEFDEVFGERA